MMGRIRFLLLIALGAIVGAVAGRLAAEVRRQQQAGEPIDVSLEHVKIRAQDLVPGIVAAVRVRDAPWSWLHIPSWLAAFGVNFGVAAVGGDLSRIREMAERAAFGLAGIEIPRHDERDDEEIEVAAVYQPADAPQRTAYGTPTAVPSTPPAPPPPSPPAFTSTHGGGSVTWTAPGPPDRRDDAAPGFTAFSD